MENIIKAIQKIPGLEGACTSEFHPNNVWFGQDTVDELTSEQLHLILAVAATYKHDVTVQAGNDCEIQLEFNKIG